MNDRLALRLNADMSLRAEMPFVVFARAGHFGIAFAAPVFLAHGSLQKRRIYNGSRVQDETALRQMIIHADPYFLRKAALLQQMPEAGED